MAVTSVDGSNEVVVRQKRRTFTAEYKRRIVLEAEQMTEEERGALLRREGLYSSHLSEWRRALREKGLVEKKRGPTANPDRERMRQLERRNARLEARLKQAELIIAAQKKLAEVLGTILPTEEEVLGYARDR